MGNLLVSYSTHLGKLFQQMAPSFNYSFAKLLTPLKRIPTLPSGALALVALCFDVGDVAAARSPREAKEEALRQTGFFTSLFVFTPALVKLLNNGAATIQQALQNEVPGREARLIKQVAQRSARSYLSVYALNMLVTTGFVLLSNELTKHGMKQALKTLSPNVTSPPS